MADQKITELNELLASQVAGDDVLPIVDVSEPGTGETKKIKYVELNEKMELNNPSLLSNLTIVASRTGNAETWALKTRAGNDPSANDPIRLAFRNVTAGTGDYTVLEITSAVSLTAPSGAELGAVNSVPFKLWLVGFNDGGTFRLGIVNTQTPFSTSVSGGIFTFHENELLSSTTIGTGSDSAGVFYSGTGVTTKALRILGFLEYTLAAVGTWDTAPSIIQVMSRGVKLPGEVLQIVTQQIPRGGFAGGYTVFGQDDTIPQITEGSQIADLDITIKSNTSRIFVQANLYLSESTNTSDVAEAALFLTGVSNAIAAIGISLANSNDIAAGFFALNALTASPGAGSKNYTIRGSLDSNDTFDINKFSANQPADRFGASSSTYFIITEYNA